MRKLYIKILATLVFVLFAVNIGAQYKQVPILDNITFDKYGDPISSTSGQTFTEEPFPFKITFTNMNVLLNMQNAMAAYNKAKVEEWMRKQEETFKNEMNRQLNTSHSTFKDAQKDFYKNYEKNVGRIESKLRDVANSHYSASSKLSTEQEKYTNELYNLRRWKGIRNDCNPIGIVDCGSISQEIINGVKIGYASVSSLNQLEEKSLADFSNREYNAAIQKSYSEGVNKILLDGSALLKMTENHVNFYNRQSLQDKIFFMTTYLTQYNNRNQYAGPLAPTISKYNVPLFWENNTLLEMGKLVAPIPPVETMVFEPNYIYNRGLACINRREGTFYCNQEKQSLIALREKVINEHIAKNPIRILREVNENPFILTDIDCNQISKWQNIVQKQASQEILKKISELPSSFSNSFELQTLNGAGGALVNLDYFSTNVTKFPNNSKTGKAYTPDEFLDYIRRNINNFNVGSKFNPYCNITSMCAKETSLWNSSNPKGAILYIDILGDDGVVITTDFSNDGWYFMTMNAPYAGNHPVSGTRQFGYEKQANGSYDFFVRGADRIDSRSIENILRFATADNPFFGADKLWQSFQEKVKAFTNGNGGISTVKQPIKNRPNWENVKDVLQGKKPISVLGCK